MNTEEFDKAHNRPAPSSETGERGRRAKEAGKDKLQEYGKEGLGPLIELLNKYGQEAVHYLKHIQEGLEKAEHTLRSDRKAEQEGQEETANEERRLVASWFEEGAKWTRKLEERLDKEDSEDLLQFVEDQGREHPAALFATSLFAGSVLGRAGKHAYKTDSAETGRETDAAQGESESI